MILYYELLNETQRSAFIKPVSGTLREISLPEKMPGQLLYFLKLKGNKAD